MTGASIYLDYAAATPVDLRVAEAMNLCLRAPAAFGNPSALQHAPGRAAHAQVERARAQVAALINATARELVWTSGASESNNLAIIGTALLRRSRGRHIVTGKTEHASVIGAMRHLEKAGFTVSYVAPDATGVVTPQAVAAALRDDTTLVSIMHVNNEIGVVQDIASIGAVCRERDVLLHVDAAQSAGRVPIDVVAQSIDLLSLSAQKLYGPKGVGVLYLNESRARRVEPLMFGGGQERGLRPGTVPTHQVVGMGEAFSLAGSETMRDVAHCESLLERLWAGVRDVPGIILNGEGAHRCCHILCVSVPGVEGESLMHGLDQRGLAVSSGAACVSTGDEPSAVLRSIGRSDELAKASVRFSVGRSSTAEQVDAAAAAFVEVATGLLRLAAPPADGRMAVGDELVFSGSAGAREHGAEVAFRVRIADGSIGRVEFRAYGCPHTLAACRWLTEHLSGLPVDTLRDLPPETLMTAVAAPAQKRGRMLVVQDALRNCFAAWDNTLVSQ